MNLVKFSLCLRVFVAKKLGALGGLISSGFLSPLPTHQLTTHHFTTHLLTNSPTHTFLFLAKIPN
jgi:hypothetical protein